MQERILTNQLSDYLGQEVHLSGWVHNIRKMGGVNFLLLRDRKGVAQAVMSEEDLQPLYAIGAQVETVIHLTGRVVEAAKAPNGCELHDVRIEPISPVIDPLPIELNKNRMKAHLPVFLDHAVVGLRHPDHKAILRVASGVMGGFRATLTDMDFTEIQTPKMVGSATEGGANVYSLDHFGQTAYLAQSPQLYKQIMVGVLERVFEVGPVFRAEPHATSRHINEYVSLDVEFGFINNHFDVMNLLNQLVIGILSYLEAHRQPELTALETTMPLLPDGEFPKIHFKDALEMLTNRFGAEDAFGAPDLTPEHERILGKWASEEHGSDFLFVVGYPMKKRPFYTHPDPENPIYSNSFDLLFRGTELVTGGQRLHLYADYLAAADAKGYAYEPFETYFEAFKHGMPPHGGFAIGMERFVMQLLGLDNIRLATLFPRDMHRLAP